MDRNELKNRLDELTQKILNAYDKRGGGIITFTERMVIDFDEIISEAFNSGRVIPSEDDGFRILQGMDE